MTPSLTTIVRRAIEPAAGEAALPRGATVLVGVSGGPDSMALLEVLARIGPKAGLAVCAIGVDHGLRDEAAAELDLAEHFAARIDVPWERTRVDVSPGGNLQERARVARWTALAAAARRHRAAIAVGHHADDRAETVLMRLLRGAGVRGLGVMPPRGSAPVAPDVTVVRPLLRARRTDVLLHLERHAIPSALDPSNVDARYLRVCVRREVLPLLERLDPRIVDHLCTVSDEIVTASSPDAAARGPSWTAALPRPTQDAIRALLTKESSTARVWLPDGLVLSRDRNRKARSASFSKRNR